MSYRFARLPLRSGLYEPEGIYLSLPFRGDGRLWVGWGDFPEHYAHIHYNGVPLEGYPGLFINVAEQTIVQAVDAGRVTEIGYEAGGIERYVKVEHWWGESLYGWLGKIQVESGQRVVREEQLGNVVAHEPQGFHFSIRIAPYNRFDGFGGFCDPLPYMDIAAALTTAQDTQFTETTATFVKPLMAAETAQMRRP